MIEQELYNHIFRLYLLMICSVANPCQTIRSLTTNLRYKAESNTPVIFDTKLRSYSNGITICIRQCTMNIRPINGKIMTKYEQSYR